MKKTKRNYAIIILLIILQAIGVGYAAFSATLTIDGTATGTGTWDVHFETVSLKTTGGATDTTHGTATINATGTAVGLNTFQLYQNGVALPGALASHTITAVGDVRNFSFETIVRVLPSCACQCNSPVNLTILNNGANTITVNNISVDVVRIN